MSTIKVPDHRQAGEGAQGDGLLQAGKGRDAGQAVEAVDVHGVGAAYPFPAGAAEAQGVVLVLEQQQGVQQHHVAGLDIQLVALHARLGVGVGVVAVDGETHQ